MGGCFSCQRSRSNYEQDRRLPETNEKEMEKPLEADSEGRPAAPAASEEAWPCLIWSSDDPEGLVPPMPESVPEAALTLEALEQQLEALKVLQCQYLQGQLRVRRLCRHFPRAVRAISLQICHARRRLIRIEVRLKRQEGPPSPASPAQVPGFEGLPVLSVSTLAPEALLPTTSTSRGLVSIGSSVSSFSLPLQPSSPPLPPSPPFRPDLRDIKETLESLIELQVRHLQDRRRDLRGCQECLKSLRALRAQLRHIRNRLWALEEKLGIQVPPRELDADEREEEKEEPEIPPPLLLLLPGVLDTSREEQEEGRTGDLGGQP